MKPMALITGVAQGIGKALASGFSDAGYEVIGVDLQDTVDLTIEYHQVDLSNELELVELVKQLKQREVTVLINNAMKTHGTSYQGFSKALSIGVTAPYYLSTNLNFSTSSSIINISSTRAHQSQANTLAYTATKGGILSLTHGLAVTLGPKVRVNAILPGWIDTSQSEHSLQDKIQHPVGRVGKVEDIVEMALYLCSEKASFITGQEFVVDGGISKLMIYHDDHGWKYQP